jgi:hypothetical protein
MLCSPSEGQACFITAQTWPLKTNFLDAGTTNCLWWFIVAELCNSCPGPRSHPWRKGKDLQWHPESCTMSRNIMLDLLSRLCFWHLWGRDGGRELCAVCFAHVISFNPHCKSKRKTLLLFLFLWVCNLRQREVQYDTSNTYYRHFILIHFTDEFLLT